MFSDHTIASVGAAHRDLPPSAWVMRHAGQIAPGGRILDVACGSGRHARWLAAQGFVVDAVDRDLSQFGAVPERVNGVVADLEAADWPFVPTVYDGIVVTNYLHRPLMPRIIESLQYGGVLIYETFASGNERFGRPSRAEFLLMPGELRSILGPFCDVLAFEEGEVSDPKPAVTQRIVARKRSGNS
jgi:SAM-dependent methyltransferase